MARRVNLSIGHRGSTPMGIQSNGVTADSATFHHAEHHLGKSRPLRIILVGAGLSGIAAVKLYKETFPDRHISLQIYEKNADVTGTWLENRYPGCACDVPAHAYTYSWEGNPRWSRAYVGAEELFAYFKGRAEAYGVGEFVKLRHKVLGTEWDEERGLWMVDVLDESTGQRKTDEGEVLVNAAGFLNNWKWPEIPGLHNFGGKLLHSACWDDSFDFQDKTVAVIGAGSSAIQIVPQLQPVTKRLTSINRSKTWITPEFAAEFAPEGRTAFFSETQKIKWENNKQEFLNYRKKVESTMNKFFDMQYKDSESQREAFENFSKTMKERLNYREDLIEKIVPDFEVGCRRVTPGHGYLEALTAPNVTVRNDKVTGVEPKGIRFEDGSLVEFDVLVCATGFDTSFKPGFPVRGYKDDLRNLWKEEPRSYLSVASAGIPNYFIVSGPNFPLANGALIPCLETNIKYAFAAAKKIAYNSIKSLAPSEHAVQDFQEYKDLLMQKLVWTGSCSSWYKNGQKQGKVWGPWPGSSHHYLELMALPGWEDYEIRYLSKNRFAFLGNGRAKLEHEEGADLAYYLGEPGVVQTC